MADISKSYVDLSRLQRYDSKIKEWANSASQAGYKTVNISADGGTLYFYKKPSAILGTDTPDETISIGGAEAAKLTALAQAIDANASYTAGSGWSIDLSSFTATDIVGALSELLTGIGAVASDLEALDTKVGDLPAGAASTDVVSYIGEAINDAVDNLDTSSDVAIASVSSNVVTIAAGIAEEDGVIKSGSGTAIALEEVAYTGDAADVATAAIDDGEATPTTLYSAGTAQSTLTAIARDLNSLESGSIVTIAKSTDVSGLAARYTFSQGGVAIGTTVDIPADMVVTEGIVVDVVFVEGTGGADNELHEGSASGTDVTEEIKGAGVNPTSADAGKYIKLTIANAAATHLWIKATDLVDIYTGGTTSEVDVDITSNVITATIEDIDASKLTYIAAQAASGDDPAIARESVKQALTRLDGADTVPGSVAKIAKDAAAAAVGNLDTSANVTLAAEDGVTGAVSFTQQIDEADGIVGAVSGDKIVFTPVTNNEIDALFTS